MPVVIQRDDYREFDTSLSEDNEALSVTISVDKDRYGVAYKIWIFLDVESETDLENLPYVLLASVTMGSKTFPIILHPLAEHTSATPTNFRSVSMGPWYFNFGEGGFYSGVQGDDIVIVVGAAGTGVKIRVNYLTAN